MEITYTELLKLNRQFKLSARTDVYNVSVLSNIVVNQITPFIEYELQREKINAIVTCGNYDNIIQDSNQVVDSKLVIIFWELCNLIEGLQYKANVLNKNETEGIINKAKSEIDLVFGNLKSHNLVIINSFSTLLFNQFFLKKNNFDYICAELNDYLETKSQSNIIIIDIDKIIARISISKSSDFRSFYSSKALYTVDFYKEYSRFITPIILSLFGKSKKALIFDCDNTLWHGILGEDGEKGIQMSSSDKKGVYFEEIQYLAKNLASKGVIIGINSKNNEVDVDAVLKGHNDLTLREDDIIIKKVNWNDKASNLKQIATELNIGEDSIVFVDDSDFEINLIANYIPDVLPIQVPRNLHEYPAAIRKAFDLFYNIKETSDDKTRLESYKTAILRRGIQSAFNDINSYLKSLELTIRLYYDEASHVDRIAQLSQKTNQFNLTTKRYTAAEIESFVTSTDYLTFAIEVKDKFGSFGITGTAVIQIKEDTAVIDSFLMSCRILGRNIEFKFLDSIITHLKSINVQTIYSKYIPTSKNHQVKDFFKEAGFSVMTRHEHAIEYILKTEDYTSKDVEYINVIYEK
jgi:FkbH-like protein